MPVFRKNIKGVTLNSGCLMNHRNEPGINDWIMIINAHRKMKELKSMGQHGFVRNKSRQTNISFIFRENNWSGG